MEETILNLNTAPREEALRFVRFVLCTSSRSPGFLVLDSRHGEVIVPSLPAGTYDLSLFDGGRPLFTLPGALTIVVPPAPVKEVPPPPKTATAYVTVRFVAEREVLDVMKQGDLDVGRLPAEAATPNPAVLTELATNPVAASR